jgi:tetratricopeptide (TPR) repeat protein
VRVLVLQHLRSRPNEMEEAFSITWNTVVQQSNNQILECQADLARSLIQSLKRYALPDVRFMGEQIGDICSLSTRMVDSGHSHDAKFILDHVLDNMDLSASDIVLVSRLHLAHARVLDAAQIGDRRQAFTKRCQAISNLRKALSENDTHSGAPVAEYLSSALFDLVENQLEFDCVGAAKDTLMEGFTLLQRLGDETSRPGDHATYYDRRAMIATHCGSFDESLRYTQNALKIASAANLITHKYDLHYATTLIREEQYLEALESLMKVRRSCLETIGEQSDYYFKSLLPIGVSYLHQDQREEAM